MAIIANIFIDQGTDFSITVDVTDSAGNVLDLTGYSAAAQIRKTYSSSSTSATFTSSHNNAGGAVTLSLTDTQTATFGLDELQYDVLLTEPSGSKNYYLQGRLFISEGYTA